MKESYFWGIITGVSLAPFYRFLTLGIGEAIVKPMAMKFIQNKFKRYLLPAYNELDKQLQLPENLERLIDKGEQWVIDAVLPQTPALVLSQEDKEDLAMMLLEKFSLSKFLEKANGRQ